MTTTEAKLNAALAFNRYALALDLHVATGSAESARELVDASNALEFARLEATLAALKATHGEVLRRAEARRARE